MLNSLAICGVVPYSIVWKGRSEARRISTHFFEQTLRIHELGVSLQSRHALDEPDTGSVQRAHHEPSQAGGQGGGAFPVTCRDVVPVPNMFDGIFQVLFDFAGEQRWRDTRTWTRTSSSKDMRPLTHWMRPNPVAMYSRSLHVVQRQSGMRRGRLTCWGRTACSSPRTRAYVTAGRRARRTRRPRCRRIVLCPGHRDLSGEEAVVSPRAGA